MGHYNMYVHTFIIESMLFYSIEIVIVLVFLLYLFFNVAFSCVYGLPPLLSIFCKGLPVVYGDGVAFR